MYDFFLLITFISAHFILIYYNYNYIITSSFRAMRAKALFKQCLDKPVKLHFGRIVTSSPKISSHALVSGPITSTRAFGLAKRSNNVPFNHSAKNPNHKHKKKMARKVQNFNFKFNFTQILTSIHFLFSPEETILSFYFIFYLLSISTLKNMNLNNRKHLLKTYIWSIMLHGCTTQAIAKEKKREEQRHSKGGATKGCKR